MSFQYQATVNDLWARAAAELSNDDKLNVNFNRPDKLNILAELHAAAEKSKQRSLESGWKYTRKSGETVIIRDVFEKIVRWIDMFKQVGDVAVQYDPAHASLPWAGIRLVLQIAVNDSNKLALIAEGLARIAELICRFAVIEALYLRSTSKAATELERAVVNLYANILGYLSKAKQYLEQGTAKRIMKSAVLFETQLDSGLDDIRTAEIKVDRCMVLVDRNDKVNDHAKLMHLLNRINAPLRRMDDNLKNMHDDLQAPRRAKILRWLSPEPYIQHHKQATHGVLAGTGHWLLSDPVFKQWKDDSASSILWLHGTPGSGKSKLVSTVIEDVLKSFKAGDSPQPIFFYCSRNPAEPERSNPTAILASLARQLSCLEPGKPLLRPTVDLFKNKEEEGFASGSLQMDESRTLILQLIAQYPLTTIVIDAMDECNPRKRHELLKTLEQILRESSGLVKIFVSSRNDQDITLRLQHYPNLEIDSRRNCDDIARFVKHQTDQLIQDGELLQYSTSQVEMKELIVDRVIKGAAGMFRWASMQLQYLCLFDLDVDIKNSLGRLPPDLHTLYAELYEELSTKPGEGQATVFKNVFHWLLCAQRTLKTEEFLCAVSMNPQSGDNVSLASKDLVLKICNNFIVFDSQLDTFRFAHLSVREFLEQRPEYHNSISNALAAEVCLWTVLSADPNFATEKLLLQLGWHANTAQARLQKLRIYADIYWAAHCKSAGGKRTSGRLKTALKHILSDGGEATSSTQLWYDRLQRWLATEYSDVRRQLGDAVPTANSALSAGLLISCAFDFEEQIEEMVGREVITIQCVNSQGRSPLQVAVRNGSCASLARLLEQDQQYIEITAEAVKEAAWNYNNGKEVMTLLLDRRGEDVPITEGVVKAAIGNYCSGKEVMTLLLDRRGEDVPITEEVVKAAIRNYRSSKEVITLLPDRQGEDVPITEEMVKAAIENYRSGKEVMTLLLDRRGEDVLITEEVVKAAARNEDSGKEVMALLLDRRGADVQITEDVVKIIAERFDQEVMTLLLDRRGADVQITEDVVKIIAERFDQKVMILLFDRRGADVRITKGVVEAAARNEDSGKEVIALLLDRRGAEVQITKEVVEAAARNEGSGKEVMALLLNRRGAEVQITKEVVMAAIRNSGSGKEVMELLFNQREEEVVKILALGSIDFEKITPTLLRVKSYNGWVYHRSRARV